MVRVPVNGLKDKIPYKHYKRYNGEEVIFACPVRPDDALLSIVTDDHDNEHYRLDDATLIKEGNMSSPGESVSSVQSSSVVLCDIIGKKNLPSFKKIHNLRETKLGNVCCAGWGNEVIEAIQRLGIRDAK